jgi:SAM-dependent methyltransferase
LQKQRVFDMPHYRSLDEAKIALLREVVASWKTQLDLKTVWDVGCGVGHYCALLRELGFEPRGVDGRAENIEEAARRVPGLDVRLGDVEDPALPALGTADMTFCLGLLYHLENPFRAIRNLAQMTGKLMVIESMCTWDELPVMHLRQEGSTEDQGLRHIAFYPSEACLIKMLYQSGFLRVFRFTRWPDNLEFRSSLDRTKQRTMLVASKVEFSSPYLESVVEPPALFDPWQTVWARTTRSLRRVGHFVTKPWPEKAATIRRLLGLNGVVKSTNGCGENPSSFMD